MGETWKLYHSNILVFLSVDRKMLKQHNELQINFKTFKTTKGVLKLHEFLSVDVWLLIIIQ